MEVNIEEIKKRNYNLDLKNPSNTTFSETFTTDEIVNRLLEENKKTYDLLLKLRSFVKS